MARRPRAAAARRSCRSGASAADDGWCEDPRDRRYNQPIRLAPEQPGDRLRRADHLYDLIVELDHNTRPRIAGRGSAVFVHVARPGFAPTAGCVALDRRRAAAPDRRASGRAPGSWSADVLRRFGMFMVNDWFTANCELAP